PLTLQNFSSNCNAPINVFLGLQCFETGIGLLQSSVHVVWWESVSRNLCHDEVFRHFQQGLGHRIFLSVGDWKEEMLFALTVVMHSRHLLSWLSICKSPCRSSSVRRTM